MNTLEWGNDTLRMTFTWSEDEPVTVRRMTAPGADVVFAHAMPIAQILLSGTGHWLASGRLVHTEVGRELRYAGHTVEEREGGTRLAIDLTHRALGIDVTVSYDLTDGVAMFRTETTVANNGHPLVARHPALGGDGAVVLESVASWASAFGAPAGRTPTPAAWTLTECDNDWLGEGRWHTTPTTDLFPTLNEALTGNNPRGAHVVTSTGTWSTGTHAPLAVLESQDLRMVWLFQIEHDAAWRWEVGRDTEDGYIALSGPTNMDHAWAKRLMPGASFTTVPASVALATDFDAAVEAVTAYRRARRVPKADNTRPLLVFNDYMNTINGDPTTAKLLPLIQGAKESGMDVFCIDAGWYDDTGDWWPSVGEWHPSTRRFPNGLGEVVDAIRDAGMIAGLWLEPEVIGVRSPMAERLPESAFFHRYGRRVVEQERYLLDVRDAAARAHLDDTVDRLIEEFGVGYFKFDYNVSPGAGTDWDTDSPGDGLLGHNRAYLDWVEDLHRRHPDLILENCSSGGMRMDFAQTSRFQVQSTSDQQDHRLYPVIAAAAPMLMTPEQSGNWAYPNPSMDAETFAFATATTLPGRFFLSGYLNRMEAWQRALIDEAVRVYRDAVQPMIGQATPFWPSGLPGWDDAVVATGLRTGDEALVVVWSRDGEGGPVHLRVPGFTPADTSASDCGSMTIHAEESSPMAVEMLFPASDGFAAWSAVWDEADGTLVVDVPKGGYAARMFRLRRAARG